MTTILVTGGCGYIGSHTIVDLVQNGFNVISVDNNSRSDPSVVSRIERITGVPLCNYSIDMTDSTALETIFMKHTIHGIIHFAAYKSVAESVSEPLLYYHNNLGSLLNLLHRLKRKMRQTIVINRIFYNYALCNFPNVSV